MCPELRDAAPARGQLISQAARGGDVHVGRTAAGDTQTPGRPVSLGIGRPPGGGDGVTATLSPAEARQLAGALLRQAAAAEDATADAATSRVEVSYLGGESYAVATRGHALLTDQPATAGGSDTAMTPTELLVASLSSCVAFYAGRYLARHGLDRDGLHVTAAFTTTAADRPARVDKIRITIRVPGGIPPGREAALLAVASHCTVHNTFRQTPDIAIELT
jgi:uncharacterized OsmC-like protein